MTMQRLINITALLILYAVALMFVTSTGGCAMSGVKAAAIAEQSNADVLRDFDSAGADFAAVKPHADAVGQKIADHGLKAVEQGKKDNTAQLDGIENLKAHDAKETAIANDYDSSWFGGKARRVALWTLIGVGALIVILIVAYFATGAGPVIGEIASFVFHFFTAGLAKLGHTITSSMQTKLAAARATALVNVGSIGGAPVALNPVPAAGSSLVPAVPVAAVGQAPAVTIPVVEPPIAEVSVVEPQPSQPGTLAT